MPSATVGPVELNEPPFALIPLVVGNVPVASKSQMILPVAISYARKCPSIDPANTAPSIRLGGASCAAEHPGVPMHAGFGAGVFHKILPDAASMANSPPPDAEFWRSM